MRAFHYCNNCGKAGHSYHSCKIPITSNGIIAFREYPDKRQYLMICRKDSIGYIDFLRGRYPTTKLGHLVRLFNEMTVEERTRIQNNDFKTLWSSLWGGKIGASYRLEETESIEKFNSLKKGIMIHDKVITIDSLINGCTTQWDTPEWGFPKGRRENQERDITCALREFDEETGYYSRDLQVVNNIVPYEEIFSGSNLKSYKHKYFIAHCKPSILPIRQFQTTEVGDMKWVSLEQAISLIRPYNKERIIVLNRIDRTLSTYSLYPR